MISRPGKYLRSLFFAPWDTTQYLPMDELIGIKDVANEWQVSPRAVQAWQAKGWMPHRQQRGKELLYRRADIEQVKVVLKLIASLDA